MEKLPDILLISEEEGSSESYISALLRYCDVYTAAAKLDGGPGWPLFHAPHLGVASLAAFLRARGFRPAVMDNILRHPRNMDEFRRAVSAGVPAVGISTTLLFRPETVRRIADEARSIDPNVKIVIGGASACRPEIREAGDIAVIGQGEKPLAALLSAWKAGRPAEEVPGIYIRGAEGMRANGAGAPDIPMNELPRPDWSVRAFGTSPGYPIEATRGCDHKCAFCAYPEAGRGEAKDPALVYAELKHNREKYGARLFRFIDADFLVRPAKCEELCDLLINRRLDVQWTCYARIDGLAKRPGLAEKMRKAGCVSLFFGIDSGDGTVLRSMRKGYTPEMIVEGAALAKNAGLSTHGNFIIGFPGETEKTVDNTLQLISAAPLDTVAFFLFSMHRDSTSLIWNDKKKWGIEGGGVLWKHATMDSAGAEAQIERAMKKVITAMPDRLIGIPQWMMLLLGYGLPAGEYLPHLRDVRDYHLAGSRGDEAARLAASRKILKVLRRITGPLGL